MKKQTPQSCGQLPLTGEPRFFLKLFIFFIVFCSGLFLSSCSAKQNSINNATVTKIGNLTMKVGDEYLLKTDSGIVNITSTKVDLDNYLKQKISVTGQFSGSTLYVDEVN